MQRRNVATGSSYYCGMYGEELFITFYKMIRLKKYSDYWLWKETESKQAKISICSTPNEKILIKIWIRNFKNVIFIHVQSSSRLNEDKS